MARAFNTDCESALLAELLLKWRADVVDTGEHGDGDDASSGDDTATTGAAAYHAQFFAGGSLDTDAATEFLAWLEAKRQLSPTVKVYTDYIFHGTFPTYGIREAYHTFTTQPIGASTLPNLDLLTASFKRLQPIWEATGR
eukprot:COSAG01_NODE_3841_length_5646_cov_2.225527_3_plen_140_part_00